jgi:hypothetical protein
LENTEENCEKIRKILKKSRLNSENIWQIWKKPKLNSEMILKIWTISVLVMVRFGKYNRNASRMMKR